MNKAVIELSMDKKLKLSFFKPSLLIAIAITLASYSSLQLATAQENSQTGELIKQQGWQLVRDNCTECHTTQIITQNSGTREVWKSRLAWMQETQGLGKLEAALESSILNYLAENYGQRTSSRRPALAAHLMPAQANRRVNR